MLSVEKRNELIGYFNNGKKMGDIYPTVSPQAVNKRFASWVKRVAYGLGAQDFHYDKRIGLSVAFPTFNPIQLEDFSTALGYEMWAFDHSFRRDGFRRPTEDVIKRAKAGFKYSVAVSVIKEFRHTLKEDQIPDPETRSFKYFKETLMCNRDPRLIFASILSDPLFPSDEEAGKALDACRRILQIKAEAGFPVKGMYQPKDGYLSRDEIATTIDLLLQEARGYAKTGPAIIV